MIEIIREESWDNTQEKMGLPKNIKQIGTPDIGERIYIENSIYQYMHPYCSRTEKSAYVLLGRFEEYGGRKCTFIEAAILLEEICFDGSLPVWNDETWAYLYRKLKHTYDEMVIVGWAMDIRGQLPNLTASLEKLHKTYFGGARQLLFLMDSLEREENFYTQKNGYLSRREGYYIYYDKSIPARLDTAMEMLRREKERPQESIEVQNEEKTAYTAKAENEEYQYHRAGAKEDLDGAYLAEELPLQHIGDEKEPEVNGWSREKTEGSRSALYRDYLREQTEKKLTKPAYSSTALLAVVALALGFAALHNYEKMNAMEETLAKMNISQAIAGTENIGMSKNNTAVNDVADNGSITIETVSGEVSKENEGISNAENGGQAAESMQSENGNIQNAESDEQIADSGQTEGNEEQSEKNNEQTEGAEEQPENNGEQSEENEEQSENSGGQNENNNGQSIDAEDADRTSQETEANQTVSENENKTGNDERQEETETMSESQKYLTQGYYVVQQGESLVGICKKIYQTSAMMDKLCEVNEIEDPDAIYAGQELKLPN